jgi:curli biogenesis system outer membrane secretion channel CsgG
MKTLHACSNLFLGLSLIALAAGCATESHQAMPTESVASAGTDYNGTRSPLVVGAFDNRSSYLRGVFSDGVDRLGGQSKTILITDLQQTGRFTVMDRDNMEVVTNEAAISGQKLDIKGAKYIITGDVTEFGRKEVGDVELFGILGSGKQQVAYSKVSLNVVNVATTEVVYSVQGAGQYQLSDREVIGFGGTSGYDSTLNGKVLDLSIREAVNKLVTALEQGKWKPE